MKNLKNIVIAFNLALLASVFWFAPVSAANVGDVVNFTIDNNFYINQDAQISAVLIKANPQLYFYVEKAWWESQGYSRQGEILNTLENVSWEFRNNIYPRLTSTFGSEQKPGVDKDDHITVLLHQMKDGASGYVRSSDQYSKLQLPDSNEREMLYLSTAYINQADLNVSMAHEFMHLITFNQKDNLQGVSEDVWLNEARADYTSTFLGYDSKYEGSNLQKRVRDFLNNPTDSLTEWQEKRSDYATASMFTHYLVDHYGVAILSDSLKSKQVGIASLNEALAKNGFKDDFAKVFANWNVALVVNDCSLDTKYCFYDKNLSTVKINPSLIFLPLTGTSSLSSTNLTKNWSANWQKIIGGNGNLRLDFSSASNLNFKVPYVVYDKNNGYTVSFLTLDKNKRGVITIPDFGTKYSSLIIMPSLQSKLGNFGNAEISFPYTFTVSIDGKTLPNPPPVNPSPNPGQGGNTSCKSLDTNLSLGVSSSQVSCLQQFLKNQDASIYPEGLVTGFFGNLTKNAVVRFQTKYQIPVTGFVGPLTRAKINQML